MSQDDGQDDGQDHGEDQHRFEESSDETVHVAAAAEEATQDADGELVDGMEPSMDEFVEAMGRYFEQYGLARIGGRIGGLLMIADRPLSLDDMAARLRVSRASISTNMRLITASGLAERVTYPGDRRDYYRMIDDAWGHSLHVELAALPALERIGERALEALDAVAPGQDLAREHLEDLVDFCVFSLEAHRQMLVDWRERRAARRAARRQPNRTRQRSDG
jgi:DNA-binding transcriptional regulator GbsR (MarR family)